LRVKSKFNSTIASREYTWTETKKDLHPKNISDESKETEEEAPQKDWNKM
jgi:hypothetical protein